VFKVRSLKACFASWLTGYRLTDSGIWMAIASVCSIARKAEEVSDLLEVADLNFPPLKRRLFNRMGEE
jgi:hypothetical protein